jgi:methylated-DNA-protein-cysteine methyltransferase related protein
MTKPFYQKVYEVVKQIPEGKVLTYGDVAKLAGSPGASRAVGSAMKSNPDKSIIPCHRVVGSNGDMHGYAFGGESVKIEILKKEGVFFKKSKVDLTKSKWQSI